MDSHLGDLLCTLARLGIPRPSKLPRVVFEPCFDGGWIAIDDTTYDGPGSPTGYGDTKREAIEDLLIALEHRFCDDKRELLRREPTVSPQTGFVEGA